MQMGKVVGTVVASRKEDVLEGMRFMVVKNCDFDGNPVGPAVIAVDAVGAGVDEIVLYASASSARMCRLTDERPVDATIMAIVDLVEVGGEHRYMKEGLDR